MNLTKGLPCPNCDRTASFQGGSFGGGINHSNIVCDCGFNAWVIFKKEGMEYYVSSEYEDREKANPYKEKEIDEIVVEKHYLETLLNKTSNYSVRREVQKALSFIRESI